MNWKTILAAGAIILFTGTIYAQTPDDQTPSNEGVCDDLVNATPGLYGLCIAYCEAQDLDGIDFSSPEAVKKAMPNKKVLENYNKKKGPNDPDMPCLLPRFNCPCFSIDDIRSIASPGVGAATCVMEPDGTNGFGIADGAMYPTDPHTNDAYIHFARYNIRFLDAECLYVDKRFDPPIARFMWGSYHQGPEVLAAFWDCQSIMYQACLERGGDCDLSPFGYCPNYPAP